MPHLRSLSLTALSLLAACAGAPQPEPAAGGRGLGVHGTAERTADVYVLFGQSNAEGYASTADLPEELRRPLPGCLVWSLSGAGFVELAGGVSGRTTTGPDWCGPELTLARALARGGSTVHLVKVAIGATALGPTPGPMNEWGADAGELYAVLWTALDDACAALRSQGEQPSVRGICMMQGESDATDAAWATGYATRLETLITRLRAELARAGHGGAAAVPFVVGLIGKNLPGDVFPWTEDVRTAQRDVAAGLPACAVVDTSDLPLQDDQTHFDTAGVIALGELFANALRRLQAQR